MPVSAKKRRLAKVSGMKAFLEFGDHAEPLESFYEHPCLLTDWEMGVAEAEAALDKLKGPLFKRLKAETMARRQLALFPGEYDD